MELKRCRQQRRKKFPANIELEHMSRLRTEKTVYRLKIFKILEQMHQHQHPYSNS